MIKEQLNIAKEKIKPRYQTLNIIEINRNKLQQNYYIFDSLKPGNKIIPVLKSNAYGHGIKQIAEILNDLPCAMIAVDGYFEAIKIKDISRHKLLVMGYILPINMRLLNNKKCSFVIQDIQGIEALASLNKAFNIHLEINSGMNRLGIKPNEIKSYLDKISQFPKLKLEGVMTHLFDADNNDQTNTKQQVKIFDECLKSIFKKGFKPEIIHIAQTAGSLNCNSHYANTLRIGIGLYGINPLSSIDKRNKLLQDLQPVLQLKSTIIKINKLKAKQKISYNGTYQTTSNKTIGVLPLGYYEWVPRELSNVGVFSYNKCSLPIRGRVCMNYTMVDITKTKLKTGDQITVISDNNHMPNSIQSISSRHKLFAYSLLTSINESIRRKIV